MIAVDTNILVHAHRTDSKFHKSAAKIVRNLAESDKRWGIPWPCFHEFFSIVTNPKIYVSAKSASKPQEAWQQVEHWMESPTLHLMNENAAYIELLKRLIAKGNISGPIIHDARIYAICEANDVTTLYTADRDFMKFSGTLLIQNPLV